LLFHKDEGTMILRNVGNH